MPNGEPAQVSAKSQQSGRSLDSQKINSEASGSGGRARRIWLFSDSGHNLRARVLEMYGLLLVFNVGAWIWAVIAFHDYPVLLGTALLAYSLGLRHAVDADHIAAIDNVTRKLMQDGKRPVAVGFMFSLGHSTVVVF